jgi:hypothetical protein
VRTASSVGTATVIVHLGRTRTRGATATGSATVILVLHKGAFLSLPFDPPGPFSGTSTSSPTAERFDEPAAGPETSSRPVVAAFDKPRPVLG